MTERRPRVGVVGTSWWAELEHLPGLRSRGDVEVAALCGRNPERLALVAGRQGVPSTYTDWREMIARGGLDVLVVATPNALHHPICAAALDAGLHVICEKPLALDLAQARDLVARADAADRRTLTFFTHREVAAARQVERLVREGFLGRPVHVSATYFTASHLKEDKPLQWRMRREEAGTGALGDIGSHLVDLVRWWLGDVDAVCGQWQTVTRERVGGAADADEDCAFLAQLACGAQAVFQASKLAPGRGNHQRVELHGTAGTLVYEAEPGYEPTFEGRVLAGRPDRVGLERVALPTELTAGLAVADPQASRDAAYRRLTDPFFAAVRGGGRATPDFRDGAAVQAVLDAVVASVERGAWVRVER